MNLFYDTISEMFSLQKEDGTVEFLGPMVQTMLKLREYGFTEKQARGATIQAIMNRGAQVSLLVEKKIA